MNWAKVPIFRYWSSITICDTAIAIDVKSKVEPSEPLYYVGENFDHPMLTELEPRPTGFHEPPSEPGGMGIDNNGGIITLLDRKGLKVDVSELYEERRSRVGIG